MSITINPDTEARLRDIAVREGQDINTLADALLNLALEWAAKDRAEAVEGIKRGLEAFEEGRYRPFREFAPSTSIIEIKIPSLASPQDATATTETIVQELLAQGVQEQDIILPGSARNMITRIANDFDAPLDEFAEYM